MTVWITNMHGMAGTAGYAQALTTDIARQMGYQELGIPVNYDENQANRMVRVDGSVAGIEANDVVILQSPIWEHYLFENLFVQAVHVRAQNVKLIYFVHDIEPAEFGDYSDGAMQQWISLYNQADGLILPNAKAEDLLRKYGLKVDHSRITYQQIWDNPCNFSQLDHALEHNNHHIQFAGNPDKFKFVNDWSSDQIHLDNYSAGDGPNSRVNYRGYFPNDILLLKMHQIGGFGLLWEADERWYKYMQVNTSSKLGAYLSADLPVIVHRGIAQEDFIVKHHLGIAVDSLDEAVDKVQNMSDDEYHQLGEYTYRAGRMTRTGMFTQRALVDAIFKTLHPDLV